MDDWQHSIGLPSARGHSIYEQLSLAFPTSWQQKKEACRGLKKRPTYKRYFHLPTNEEDEMSLSSSSLQDTSAADDTSISPNNK
jgi:hypothetical protein